MSVQATIRRHTLRTLARMKCKERVAVMTAYDVMTARCLDDAGMDILLIGDSVGNVVYGYDSTLPVDLDTIVRHSAAVVRGSQRAFVVADLPFMSYQASVKDALHSAGRCMAEAGVQGVKIEGASKHICKVTRRLVETGIPVMGHIGLTPQSVHQMGGYYTHGKTEESRKRLLEEAWRLADAGCFAIVLECVTEDIAREISAAVDPLTIGIGSGNVCDGEVLVVNDVLGYTDGKAPKFAKVRAHLAETVNQVARDYIADVKRSASRTERIAEKAEGLPC